MKKSLYVQAFETGSEYVVYSWLGDRYVPFPVAWRGDVERILSQPDDVLTSRDAQVYKSLVEGKALISSFIDEYAILSEMRNEEIYRSDRLSLTILPTLNCNCRCPYCYEVHPSETITPEVVEDVKALIDKRIDKISFLRIEWFGGEPLLVPDVIEDIGGYALALCQQRGTEYKMDITTNAVLLTPKVVEMFDRIQLRGIHFTLDGSRQQHDKTRVPLNGKPTYDTIVQNVINFLSYSPHNTALVRVHLHSLEREEIEGIVENFARFRSVRDRVAFYFRDLHTPYTEEWKERKSLRQEGVNPKLEIVHYLSSVLRREGFSSSERVLGVRKLHYCYAELRYHFNIRPDGYVTKCTVAIEKERAVGKLMGGKIHFFPMRHIPFLEKKLMDNGDCRGCSHLPFCWGQCAYQNYQNGLECRKKCQRIGDGVIMEETREMVKKGYVARLQGVQ